MLYAHDVTADASEYALFKGLQKKVTVLARFWALGGLKPKRTL
jgi:hypothetical protein